MADVSSKPLDELELSMRSSEVLRSLGIETIGHVTKLREADVLSAEGGNVLVVQEIDDALYELGLAFSDP